MEKKKEEEEKRKKKRKEATKRLGVSGAQIRQNIIRHSKGMVLGTKRYFLKNH